MIESEVDWRISAKVDFRLISDGRFPLKDGEVDAVYSVSVLEHIPDFENTIKEVHRVLKPNGLFILTIDLDLCGYMDIGIRRYHDLRQCLVEHFDMKEPEVTVHPLDMLIVKAWNRKLAAQKFNLRNLTRLFQERGSEPILFHSRQ